MQNHHTTMPARSHEYRLDTTSHLSSHLNRVSLQATFKLGREYGLSHDDHLKLMRGRKQDIRRRDAEPAAWFVGPDRMKWVALRYDRGDFKDWTNEQLGRELTGKGAA